MIVGAVILSGMLPGMSAFQNADGTVKGIHILGEVTLGFPSVIEIVIILLAAFLSFKTTKEEVRIRNHLPGGDSGSCGSVHRNLYHDAACIDDPEGKWCGTWYQ